MVETKSPSTFHNRSRGERKNKSRQRKSDVQNSKEDCLRFRLKSRRERKKSPMKIAPKRQSEKKEKERQTCQSKKKTNENREKEAGESEGEKSSARSGTETIINHPLTPPLSPYLLKPLRMVLPNPHTLLPPPLKKTHSRLENPPTEPC